MNSTCGRCYFSGWKEEDIQKCSVCLGHLCESLQKGRRTVCCYCIEGNMDRLSEIFVDGKDGNGNWIDPGTKQAIPTCKTCDVPILTLTCQPLLGGCSRI